MEQDTEKIKKYFQEVKDYYDHDPRQDSFNLLLLGEYGTGKTLLSRTARLPVHIDSFDPGGTKSVKDWIDKGYIIADTRFEGDNPAKPDRFSLWKTEFAFRESMGYFNALGTYVLDSSTSWADSIMYDVQKKAGKAGEAPRWAHDYMPQKTDINLWLRKCLDLPCDFILTGHMEQFELVDDEGRKTLRYRFLTTGKGTVTIPLLFDEIWVLVAEPKPSAQPKRYVITTNVGMYAGRTRIGRDKFDLYERPDIKYLLKKAGKPCEDKELLK
jgi:hypothetical protein